MCTINIPYPHFYVSNVIVIVLMHILFYSLSHAHIYMCYHSNPYNVTVIWIWNITFPSNLCYLLAVQVPRFNAFVTTPTPIYSPNFYLAISCKLITTLFPMHLFVWVFLFVVLSLYLMFITKCLLYNCRLVRHCISCC